LYGLFSRTRRRYVIEAIMGAVFALFLFVAWWLGWPTLRQRLTAVDLPPVLQWIVRILDFAPWILLGAALCKGMEVLIVLRSFAHKEASHRIQKTASPH
jgi:hypothetical protein